MKTMTTWICMAALGLVLAGCEGTGTDAARLANDEAACAGSACKPDRPAPPEFCGGIAGIACADGMQCVDIPSDDCDPSVGADCPARCEPNPNAECTTDAECLGDLRCYVCPDGQELCPMAECSEGRCFVAIPDCAPLPPMACGGRGGPTCPDGFECVDAPTAGCPGGLAADCPGECVPQREPQCETSDECLAGLSCYTCPNGEEACPFGECIDGNCLIAIPDCAPPVEFCGGLLGLPCADGYVCVDMPTEECPGGMAADCPGQCVPDVEPKCNEDFDCPQLRAKCSECADGSYTCPTSSCVEGLCRIEFDTCPETVACGSSADCAAGFVCNLEVGDGCFPDATGTNCGGICVPDMRPPACGGFAGLECPGDHECVDDPSDDCDPATGGADCGGVCQPIWERECKADDECPQIRMACSVCPDGSNACPSSVCDAGRCTVNFPTCPYPGECTADDECKPGYHCGYNPLADCMPRPDGSCPKMCLPDEQPGGCGGFAGAPCSDGFVCNDDPSDECDPNTGGADCPGVCEPESAPACESEADCPQILAMCAMCPDGSYSCPSTFCHDGQCGVSVDSCPDSPRCGGIAGFECKPGYSCIDDHADDCDPANGGADCGGICVIEEKPPQCTQDGDCMQIMAPCHLCDDGGAACPYSYCDAGECRSVFPSCAPPRE